MKIAVVGAGFCGLALAYELASTGDNEVVIFDSMGIGNGASGVAAGLMHAYAGAHSKKNQNADRAMLATGRLLQIAEKTINQRLRFSTGLLRLATSQEQYDNFKRCSELYSDVRWMEPADSPLSNNVILPFPGIFIETGAMIDCKKYLQGLFQACRAFGVTLIEHKIESLKELVGFDHVVIAMGAASASFPELSHLRVIPVKGQVLELGWPMERPPLPFPVSSQAYLMMAPDGATAIAGATFEHYFSDERPDMSIAAKEILPKIQAFCPSIDAASVIGCRAGIRASSPGHRPISIRAGERLWVLSGMGSKGLLYHAIYAAELSRLIASSGR